MACLKPNEPGPNMKQKCSMCNVATAVVACGDGFICEPCADRNRAGRDLTTRQAKMSQKALRGKSAMIRASVKGESVSDTDVYAIESAALLALDDRQGGTLLGAGGEALPQGSPGLLDTMQNPTATALDASAERLRLLDQVGIEVTALALDAGDSIQAGNSLEKMLSHQLAALHKTALDYMGKANLQQDAKHACSMMNLSIRAMETYQRGVLTVKRLRSNGEQKIVIQHVDVKDGGMAAFGQMPPRGTGTGS